MKLALKNILKLIKNLLVLLSIYSYTYGCGNNGFEDEKSRIAVQQNDETAYQEFLAFTQKQTQTEGLHLFFFDVKHGNFILVRDKNSAMVIDAGSENRTKVNDYIKVLFQYCLGNATLRQIIITHDHKDHKNYVDQVKEWGKVRKEQSLNSIQNPFYSSRVISQHYLQEVIRPICLNSVIAGVKLSFLQPLTELQTNSNNEETIKSYENHRSSVFTLTYDGIKVLFTGDATGKSLDNYVEKCKIFDGSKEAIVDANRKILENVHLFVLPHHGSSTDDSFRWTLYIMKHSNNLIASVISADAFAGQYKDIRSWIRDVSWPFSMKNTEIKNYIQYWSAGIEKHQKLTQTALFITGADPCHCVYFKIYDKKLYKYDAKRKDFIYLSGWPWFFGDNGKYYEGYDDVDNTIPMEMEENNSLQVLPSGPSSAFNGNLMQNQKKKELSPIKKSSSPNPFSINLQTKNPFTNGGVIPPKPPRDSSSKGPKKKS